MEILFGIVVVGLVCVVAYYVYQQRQKRIAAMAALASQLGLRFSEGQDPGHDDRFAQFAIFRRGTSRIAYNTMSGSSGIGPFTQAFVLGDFN